MIKLIDAPQETLLKIVDFLGGEGMRRRLFALGFHKGDLIEVDSQGIFQGPLLVRNLTSDTAVALGKGIAQKILVDLADGKR